MCQTYTVCCRINVWLLSWKPDCIGTGEDSFLPLSIECVIFVMIIIITFIQLHVSL